MSKHARGSGTFGRNQRWRSTALVLFTAAVLSAAANADISFSPASPTAQLAPGGSLTIGISTDSEIETLTNASWTEGGGATTERAQLSGTSGSVTYSVPSDAAHCDTLSDRLTAFSEIASDGTTPISSNASTSISVTVVDAVTVSPSSASISGDPGSTQTISVQVSGGTAPYGATSSAGATIDLSGSTLSYTIPTDQTASYTDRVTISGASSGNQCSGNSTTMSVNVEIETEALSVTPSSQDLGEFMPGATVDATLSVSGGLPGYTASVTSGPDGSSLTGPSSDGALSYSYTVPADAEPGSRSVTIEVTDSGSGDAQQTASATLTFSVGVITETLTMSPSSRALGELAPGDTAETTFTITGGAPSYSARIVSGPDGAQLSGPSSDGTLTFTYSIPSDAETGARSASIEVTDSGDGDAQQSATADVTFTVSATPSSSLEASPSEISLSAASLASSETTVTESFSVSGGTAPYSLSVAGISGGIVGTVSPARLTSAGSAEYSVDIPASAQSDLAFVNEIRITDAAGNATAIRVDASIAAANALSSRPDLSPNQRSVARAVETVCPQLAAMPQRTAEQEDLFVQCSNMLANARSAGIPDTLEAITNEKANAAKTAGIETGTQQLANVASRLAALRAGARGIDIGGLAFSADGQSLSGKQLASLTSGATGGAASADGAFGKWGFFLNGTVNFGDQDTTDNETGFDYSTTGITGGVDYRFTDDFIAGGAFGYATNDIDFDSDDGGLETETWHLAAYATSYVTERMYVDAIIEYGWHDYDAKRNIDYQITSALSSVSRQAEAAFSGTQLGASLGTGYDINEGPFAYGFYGKVAYLSVDVDDYREENAGGLNLEMDGFDASSVTTTVGTRVSRVFNTGSAVLVPQARLEWEHEYDNDASTLTARFAADPTRTTFEIETDEPDRDYFRLGVGLSAIFPGGVSSYLNYSTLLDKRDTTDHLIDAGVRWEFY